MIAFVKSVISGDDNPEPHNIDDVDINDQIPTTKSFYVPQPNLSK